MAQEYGIRELPPASTAERPIEDAARTFLQARAAQGKEGQQAWIATDKAKRDASLYAALVRTARAARAADPDGACLLVSSARLLSVVEDELREVGEPQLVVSLGATFFLLSLVPGVSLGVGAMQTLLFDLHARLSNDLERVVLRIVHDSAELSIPWAKRPALLRELRTRLYKDADRSPNLDPRSPEARAIEKASLNDNRLQRTAVILKESLASVAADQRLATENAELRDVVAALERQLESLQKQRRMGTGRR
jgi:hypothetical protein